MSKKNFPKLFGVVTTCAVMAAGLAGCGSHSAAAPVTTKESTPHITKGGTIVDALGPLISINWYNPLRPNADNSLYDAWAASLMYKGLFHIASNGTIDYARSIASNIRWNKTGTVYTVTMNKKWHWSDGTPVTAQDVAFSWHLIQAASSPNAPAPWPYAGAGSGGIPTLIQKVQVVSAHSFQVTLTHPVNQIWFEYNGLADLVPLPEQSWNRYPDNVNQELTYLAANADNVSFFHVVDGPFRIVSAVQNSAWTYLPNTHYDGHKPYINKLILAYETSETSAVNGLKTGTVQVGYLPLSMYSIRKQLPQDNLFTAYTYSIARNPLNFRNPQVGSILRELPVRQALEMGIDQPAIIRSLYNGMGVLGTGPVPLHPATFIAPQLTQAVYPFNINAGKALLEKNGWHMVKGVMTNQKGQKLNFSMQFAAGSNTTLDMAQLMQQDWAKEGIKVSLTPVEFVQMLQYHAEPSKWEIQTGLNWSYGGTYPTGGGMYSSTGGYNFYGYDNSQMNQLVNATHMPQPSPQAAQRALDAYQVFAAKQLPNLWMPMPEDLGEVAQSVHGVTESANNFTNAISPQYWWVSPS